MRARDGLVGDLDELYAGRVTNGRVAANLWYTRQVASAILSYAIQWRPGSEAVSDIRLAVRSLLRSPTVTGAVVGTLAVGIGAVVTIFAVVDTVLLQPLSFPESDRLVSISASAPGSDLPDEFGPGPEFVVQYRSATGLEDLGYYTQLQMTVRARAAEHVERLSISSVSPRFFTTLGVEPMIGRLPTEDDKDGDVVVISYWLWTTWFGQDPSVVGQAIDVGNGFRIVVGVMEPSFQFPSEQTALWVNDRISESIRPGSVGLNLIGRMGPETDQASLAAELQSLAQQIPDRFGGSPDFARIIAQHRPVVRLLEEELVGDIRRPLWILMGTAGFVLLIACSNVANLLAVRATSRSRSFALRRALGADRGAILRLHTAETAVLICVGGAGAAFFTWLCMPLLVRSAPTSVPRLGAVNLDVKTLVVTAGVATLAAGMSGFLPALHSCKDSLPRSLTFASSARTARSRLVQDALVVIQTSAALVLLVGAGLLIQSFQQLRNVDPGYTTENIFTFQMAPEPSNHGVKDGATAAQFHYAFMERLRAIPGVESVGVVNELPLDDGAGQSQFATPAMDAAGRVRQLPYTFAGGDYFQTLGIQLLRGDYFERKAIATSDVKIVVSASAAESLWPGQDPIGRQLRRATGRDTLWMTVGGVVNDVILADFRHQSPGPLVYLPMVGHTAESWAVATPAYVVRTANPETIQPTIREVIREVAPEAPMYRVFTMAELAARSMAALSFTMLTLGIAAGLALILSVGGLYGVLSYVVSQRTREIGVRMALGAREETVRRMVVARGALIGIVGVSIGVLGAIILTELLDSLLFGVEALSLGTFLTTSIIVVGALLCASYVPAVRASRVDPVVSLRTE